VEEFWRKEGGEEGACLEVGVEGRKAHLLEGREGGYQVACVAVGE